MTTTAYLGIDIAKRKFDVALARPDGTVRVKACPNTPAGYTALVAWVARHHAGPIHACLEATGPYGEPVAAALADAGYTVSQRRQPGHDRGLRAPSPDAHEN